MKSVTVSVEVATPRTHVYEFLDVLANHEPFLDHALVDWEFSGPRRGVGAKARARSNAVGSQDWTEFEVLESDEEHIVEDGLGAGGKRHTRGTYRFGDLANGGTAIGFELEWLQMAKSERLAPPLMRAFMRRVNGKAMRRLAKQLDG
ncbi:MAG: SRPBCC family protein [Solirubrobacterales bacterium]